MLQLMLTLVFIYSCNSRRFRCRPIDVFHKWRLWHGNEACMLFSRSRLVSNYQTDLRPFSEKTIGGSKDK